MTWSRPRSSTRMSEVNSGHGPESEADGGQIVEALPAEPIGGAPDPHALGLELPEEAGEAIKVLLLQLEAARNEGTSYLDDLKRVAADFDNYRKRTMRDQATTLDKATEKVVTGLLPVLDTFDAALMTEAKSDTERQLYKGMINTREQLLKALEANGLEVITTIGELFNPEVHEPVGAPGGTGELVVSQEMRRGYRLNGRVLRAALVVLEVSE